MTLLAFLAGRVISGFRRRTSIERKQTSSDRLLTSGSVQKSSNYKEFTSKEVQHISNYSWLNIYADQIISSKFENDRQQR